MKIYKELLLRYAHFLFVIFLSLLSVLFLFHYGLIPTHDGEYHVVRFYEFYKVLSSGEIIPRWAPNLNNGYGIPLFNFVYPFPNYVASFLHLLGINFIDAFKANIILSSLASGIFFYLWISKLYGKMPGVVASAFYLYAPYRFVDIYVRGSVGELWSMAFFIGFLWSVSSLKKDKKNRYFTLSSVFLALTVLSHNILGLLFFGFAVIYIFFLAFFEKEKFTFVKKGSLTLLIGLGLSSFFWLPALVEKEFTRGLQIFGLANNFPELYQLLFPSWGTGFSAGDLNNQMSFQIGIANICIILLCMGIFLKKRADKRVLLFYLGIFFGLIYLILPYSEWIWSRVSLLQFFQFSWRLLSLVIIITAFLAGYISYFYSRKILYLFLIVFAVATTISYTKPAYYLEREDSYYFSRSNFMDGTNSPGDSFNTIWMNQSLQKADGFAVDEDQLTVKKGDKKSTEHVFTAFSQKQQEISLAVAYFPGWEVSVDEKKVGSSYNEDGLVSFTFPQGEHSVRAIFVDTPIRKGAEMLSVITLVFLLLIVKLKKI